MCIRDSFVTAFIGILDPAAHTVEYISGGQGPLILVTPGAVENRVANSFPFAVVPGVEYDEPERFELEPGATLVLLTDGFYEAAAPDSEQFGEPRVIKHVQRRAATPVEELIESLYEEVRVFTQGGRQADDLTAVVIRRG